VQAARLLVPGCGEAAGRIRDLIIAMSFPVPRPRACLRARQLRTPSPLVSFSPAWWRLALLPALLPLNASAQAQAEAAPQTLQTIVVTATRSPQPLAEVLADVSVLERSEIERSGATGVADLLARLPGIEFARNGGPGTSTSVFLRGSEARHTAVYLDGVRLDSQSTGGAVWEQIPLSQIERIEVLRGPAAAVYGSDAVGGVVQLFTRRGEGAAQPTASLAVGSQDTVQAQAGLSGAAGALDYALSASAGRSRGFNARTTATSNPDDDGWRQGAVSARLGWQAAPGHRVNASLLATRLKAQYDGSADADDLARHSLRTTSLAWDGQWSEQARSGAQASESRSTYETSPSPYRTETTLRDLTAQHEQRFGAHRLSLLLERREDRLLNPATEWSDTLAGRRSQTGVMLGWRADLGDHGLQAHVRHDDDSEFGGQSTGSLAWGWRWAPAWRVTAAAATSFRVPTLYQRFSEYGVATLVPETGRNLELGLRWAEGRHELGLAAWRNTVSQLINFGAAGPCASTFGCYENVGRARYEGATLSGRTALGPVALQASADWHDPRNLDTGKRLARRASRLATLAAEVPWAGWSFGAELQAAGARFDDAANTRRMGGYSLFNLRASRPLAPGWTLEGRIDNLADKAYELARTYATAGRTAQLALRWAPLP
jgi:vitamin B12 transporter